MRFLHFLMLPLLAALAFVGNLIAATSWAVSGHRHLAPGTPRSIVQTRRMGLA